MTTFLRNQRYESIQKHTAVIKKVFLFENDNIKI